MSVCMNGARAASLALLAGCLVSGCFASEGFPEDAQIPCDGAADCPGGWVCHPAMGRCVVGDSVDVELPSASATVEPLLARDQDVITVFLDASEALLLDPVVSGVGTGPFAVDESRTDRAALRWVFQATIADSEDGPREVTAALTDAFGNEATVELGEFVLDNTPPGLDLPVEIASDIETDYGADVWLVLTEELAETPRIDLAPRFDHPGYLMTVYPMPSSVEGAPQVEWEGIYYRTGEEPLTIYDVVLTAVDLVGNYNVLLLGTVEFTAIP